MQGGGREAKQRRKRGKGSGGGSGRPGPRLHPPPEQTSSGSHRNGSGPPLPARRVRIFEGVRCVRGRNAAGWAQAKGSGGWARAWGRVSQSVPPAGPATGHRRSGCLGAPLRAARGPDQAGRAGRSWGPGGLGSQSSPGAPGGLARGPLPRQSLPRSDPRSSGSEGGRPRWSPDPSFPSRASGQDAGGHRGETPWQRGGQTADGRTRGGGRSTIGRPNQASRQTDEGNNIITPRTPWGRYSKYLIK